MISSKRFESVDGATNRFLSDFIIQSEQHCRVYMYKYNPSCALDTSCDTIVNGVYVRQLNSPQSADIVTVDKWDLVDNSIVFYTTPLAGVTIVIEVATTPEEFGDVVAMPSVLAAQSYAASALVSSDSAATSALSASTSATASTTSATSASNSATSASTSATNAAASALSATTQASNAATSAASAATSATNASNSATSASTSATNASNSELAASNSATDSANSASISSTQAVVATTKATEAAASAASIDPLTLVHQDSSTGAAFMPSGTTAQRPTVPSNGYMRYNTDLKSAEVYSNGAWGSVGGGATGGGTDHVFVNTEYTINNSYIIPAGRSSVIVSDSSNNVYFAAGVQIDFSAGSKVVIL